MELFLSKMEVKAHNCLTQEEKKVILANYVIGRFEPKPRTGKPPMTTKQEDWMIVKMSLKDHFNTAMSISHAFCEQTGNPISRKTVSHRLNKEKLMAQIPCHKPMISKKNQKVCLDFTTEHILWTEEQWKMVHFSEESKFHLFGSDGKTSVRCKNGAYLLNALRKL